MVSSTHELLEDIVASCEPYQCISNAQRRFRVTIGRENVRFNAEVYIDIMYIDGGPVLHIVDAATPFSATFLLNVTSDAVWEVVILC